MNHLYLLLIYYPRGVVSSHNIEQEKDEFTWFGSLAFFLPIVIIIVIVLYQRHKFGIKKVENGIFKADLPLNRDNLFEAYLCLAVLMIQKEKLDAGKKIVYIKKYFLNYFPENYYNFSDTILEYFKGKTIQPKSVSSWINRFVKDYEKRNQILYFLAGISMVDGEIVSTELAFLQEMTRLLKLNEEDLESILNTYSYYENKRRQEKRTAGPSNFSNFTLISAFKVIGLEKGATIEQVKSAYRKMAMLHHPDKFSTESEMQQKIAHERFLKINEAYEYVLKSFK